MTYAILVIDRNTGEVVKTETRKTLYAANKVWQKATVNVNPSKYKLVWNEVK